MKRFISIFFTLCLVVALSLSASAESTNKLTYAVGASAPTVSANTDITIMVEVTENTGICWLKAVVTYDSSVLSYVGYTTDTSVFKSDLITVNSSVNGNEGKIIIVVGSMEVIYQDNPTIYKNVGKLVDLNFKVSPVATSGTSTIVGITSTKSNVVKRVNKVSFKDFVITDSFQTIKVIDKDHTCTPGNPIKQNETPATCSTMGSYEEIVKCTKCNEVISTKTVVVPMNNEHNPGVAVKENEKIGDCKTASSYDSVVYCQLCNKEISRTKQTGAKGEHKPGTPTVSVVEATCQKKGTVTEINKCTVCGTETDRKTSELPMIDHVPGNPVTEKTVAATCLKPGSFVNVVYCSMCNKVLSSETKTTDVAPHTPGKAVEENKKAPVNCGADGSYDSVVYCSVCNKEMSRVKQAIPAPKHTPGPAATETTAQICTVCNALLAPPLGHTHHWVGTLSSDNNGHWYACSGCSEKKDYVEHKFDNNCDADCNICGFKRTPADHVYTNWATTKEPAVGVAGQRERSCMLCGKKITESIPALDPPTTTTPPEVTTTTPEVTTATPEVTTATPEVTTEPAPTTSESEVTTESTPGTTVPEATDPEATTDSEVKDPGCGSAVSIGIALIAILGTALIMKKRD